MPIYFRRSAATGTWRSATEPVEQRVGDGGTHGRRPHHEDVFTARCRRDAVQLGHVDVLSDADHEQLDPASTSLGRLRQRPVLLDVGLTVGDDHRPVRHAEAVTARRREDGRVEQIESRPRVRLASSAFKEWQPQSLLNLRHITRQWRFYVGHGSHAPPQNGAMLLHRIWACSRVSPTLFYTLGLS